MATWDIFHADSLELERGLSTEAIRAAAAGGSLRDDDLVRPAGTAAWSRLGDFPELTGPHARAAEVPADPVAEPVPGAGRLARQPPASTEPPQRIRAGRDEPPPTGPAPGDFELRADRLGEVEEPAVPTAPAAPSTAARPAWSELGRDPDDVSFPVISDSRREQSPVEVPPGAETRGKEPGFAARSDWAWPDDEDEAEAESGRDAATGGNFDEQIEILDDDAHGLELLDEDGLGVPSPLSREAIRANGSGHVALPVVPSRDWNEDRPPEEGGDDNEFTLSRSGPMTVEELDLAPMVDVAFQLVLFFMVTATTVLYKTLEIPKPTTDQAPSAVAQGHSRSMDDLQKDYVLVEIDAGGAVKIDQERVAADVDAIADRLRIARDKTGRKVMLLSADYTTPHRNAVLAYDAAIEIGMGISIARPTAPQGPAPSVFGSGGRAGSARSSAGGRTRPSRPARNANPSADPAPASAPL